MNSFRSEVFPEIFEKRINYSSQLIFIGSCFAENIGQTLLSRKFPALINPFGIMYNPLSVSNCLKSIVEEKKFCDSDLRFYNEKWISFDHHGKFSGNNREAVLNVINKNVELASDFLKSAEYLFITFGTSWVYELIETNKVVANCHKMPANQFKHFLLNIEDITSIYNDLFRELKNINPQLEIVLTVSPVRHWKDGAVNNQISKSILLLSVKKLVEDNGFVSYFPSYELVMDDLRDYRFFGDDMFHPNKLAIDYIWEKFRTSFIDNKTDSVLKDVEKLIKNKQHRVFYPQTEAYKKFLLSNLKLIEKIKQKENLMNLDEEKEYFQNEANKYWPE